ncbi:Nuclear poly(A) polymerase 3 [Camellia lanceoleosa]|uniref:Nuclear poly(A) polymerase 3 n=1 Tax=Camellia lanceoleosa TaxID=1840588 RepID=A0ACC0GVY8_9ERIC|nr:Nuclear poly(A) polymerase 3 [Camellia lanceoleosa]
MCSAGDKHHFIDNKKFKLALKDIGNHMKLSKEWHQVLSRGTPLWRIFLLFYTACLQVDRTYLRSTASRMQKFDLPCYDLQNVDILNPFLLSDIDETSWSSLSGVHANKCILRLLPNMELSSMLSMGSYGNQYQPILCRSSFERNLSNGFSRDAERAESIWTPR